MKTPEDEAFDELSRRQGAWGGGFPAKRQMAADKLQEPWDEDKFRRNNWRCSHGWLRGEQCEICIAWNAAPESAKYLSSALDAYGPDAGISLDQKVWSKLHAAIKAVITPSAQEPTSGDYALGYAEGFNDACKKPAQELVECLDCGSNNVGLPATYDSLVNSVKAQPVQEPVCDKDPQGCWNVRCQLGKQCKNLLQPKQDPVAWQWLGSAHFRKKLPKNADITAWNPLYTAPPQRPWVGLTAEETSGFTSHEMTVVKYVSKVLQEKNNGA